MRSKQHHAGKLRHALVERGDGLKIEMVGRLVEDEHICAGEHHLCQHAAVLFTAGEHARFLERFLTGEEQPAKPAADGRFILILGELPEPIHQRIGNAIKIRRVVAWQIGLRGGYAPFEAAGIGLHLLHQNLKQRGARELIFAHKRDLIPAADDETHVVEHVSATDVLGQPVDGENIVAHLAVWLEVDKRIPARGRSEITHVEVIEHLLARGCLL
ncbi:hypothetical protein SDC9_156994 [bioreactor metagenome]|uniref:Uncharacterized protein n=1 Tax=bioreactor metagenome TaxID=1076179 RepID=A0A645F846_9ZZZZ